MYTISRYIRRLASYMYVLENKVYIENWTCSYTLYESLYTARVKLVLFMKPYSFIYIVKSRRAFIDLRTVYQSAKPTR